MRSRPWIVASLAAAVLLAGVFGVRAFYPGLQAKADRIQAEVAGIRGLPFRQHVEAGRESNEEFRAFIDRQLRKHPVSPYYGVLVRTVGLYRGPVITDAPALFKDTMTIAGGAYYDVERRKFFVLRDIPEPRFSGALAHELYHALQDQHFSIERYEDGDADRELNSDERLARRAVIEGEATYIQILYSLKAASRRTPSHEVLGEFIRRQPENDHATALAAANRPGVEAIVGEEGAAALRGAHKVPPFMWDLAAQPYVRGVELVHALHARGWGEVEKLYREYPPASMEQVLHPEKWFAREAPVAIAWPAFADDPLWANWEVLGQDVLGEFQLGLVFRENGFASEAAKAAAGWGGDRYAVLRNRQSGRVLLLMYTSWDTDEDAREFAEGYRRLLAAKYANEPTPTRMLEKGRDVIIVEGGEESSLASFMAFAEKGREGPRT